MDKVRHFTFICISFSNCLVPNKGHSFGGPRHGQAADTVVPPSPGATEGSVLREV